MCIVYLLLAIYQSQIQVWGEAILPPTLGRVKKKKMTHRFIVVVLKKVFL